MQIHPTHEIPPSVSLGLQFSAQNMDQSFNRQLDEEKRLGDEIVAAGHGGTGAVVEVAQAGDEHYGRLLVEWQCAELGAKFKAGHAGHVHVKEHEVKIAFGEKLVGGFRRLDVDGLELRLFKCVDDG